jgi:hypothetical protein
MANYPTIISQAILSGRAKPDEAIAVRIEVRGVHNFRPFTLPGASTHRYQFLHDPKANCHALEFPQSVWMEKDGWIARDLMGKRRSGHALLVLVKPWVSKTAKTEEKPAAKPLSKVTKPKTEKTPEQRALEALSR